MHVEIIKVNCNKNQVKNSNKETEIIKGTIQNSGVEKYNYTNEIVTGGTQEQISAGR